MKKVKSFHRIGILVVFFVLICACGGSDAILGEAGLSRQLDSNGQSTEQITSFKPGETVIFYLEFEGGYEGLESTITWKRGDQVLQTETVKLDREANSLDPLWISARLETNTDWPVGKYQCEYYVPDQGTNSITFSLE